MFILLATEWQAVSVFTYASFMYTGDQAVFMLSCIIPIQTLFSKYFIILVNCKKKLLRYV